MDDKILFAVEFFNGPYDGMKHVTVKEPQLCAAVVVVPLEGNAQGVAGCLQKPLEQDAAAVYELGQVGTSLGYRYLANVRRGDPAVEQVLAQWDAHVLTAQPSSLV